MELDDYTEAMLDSCVVEKLTLIPDHAKFVFSPYGRKSIGKAPETLHVMYQAGTTVFTLMTEIFNKRWQTLDIISMMQQFERTFSFNRKVVPFYSLYTKDCLFIMDSLSTLSSFQKKEEGGSL